MIAYLTLFTKRTSMPLCSGYRSKCWNL